MDGAYVSEDCIIGDKTVEKTIYSPDSIKTRNKQGIIERNLVKSKNIDKLSETSVICGKIPYSAYYMFCNLDHVLYNKLNSTDVEKGNDYFRRRRKEKEN